MAERLAAAYDHQHLAIQELQSPSTGDGNRLPLGSSAIDASWITSGARIRPSELTSRGREGAVRHCALPDASDPAFWRQENPEMHLGFLGATCARSRMEAGRDDRVLSNQVSSYRPVRAQT